VNEKLGGFIKVHRAQHCTTYSNNQGGHSPLSSHDKIS